MSSAEALDSEIAAIAPAVISAKRHGVNLFLVGFLVLFLELACIRWFAASVIFLQFFTNVILLASFLGMSCGCLAARNRRDWLKLFPFIALAAVIVGTNDRRKFAPGSTGCALRTSQK